MFRSLLAQLARLSCELLIYYAPISGMSYFQYLGLGGGKEGNWHVLMEQAPIPGAQSCVPPPNISLTNTPYLPVVHSVWQGDMGICGIQKEFPKTFLTQQKRIYMQFEWIGTIPTKYQPLGEDSEDKSPSFLQHPSQVYRWAHTIDRCIITLWKPKAEKNQYRAVYSHFVNSHFVNSHFVNSHLVNFPLRQFPLCQFPFGQCWQSGNWQSRNWRSGKLTKWEDLPIYILLTTVIDQWIF